VEQQYNRLQQEGQSVTQGIQGLAGKLKTVADDGSAEAREWLLDLMDLALNIQQEQQQVMMLMQAMHQAVQNELQQSIQPQSWQPGYPQTPQEQGYPQAQPQQGGFLNHLEHSGFGQALMMGAGFGIGDDLINSIF